MRPAILFKRTALVNLLIALLIPAQIVVASTAQTSTKRHTASPENSSGRPIEGDARIVYLLNRATFGPRPGDVAKVKQIGIHAWIEQQLHPGTIDDSALNAKLKMYPAMQMDLQDLMEQLPPPPVIRQAMNGKIPVPVRQPLNAVYETQMALIEMRQQGRAENSANANKNDAAQNAHEQTTAPDLDANKKKVLADLEATGVVNLPPGERIQKVLAMQPMERIEFFRDLSSQERMDFYRGLTSQQAQLFSAMRNPVRTVASQLEATKMLRVIDSNRQLQEVMTDFWLNHFNVDIKKSPLMAYYLRQYEKRAIAPNALGHFEDLLVATAKSPAMLLYLDNATSVGPHSQAAMRVERVNDFAGNRSKRPAPGINENYGRELMELHTLGVNGGYTQQDVIEVAKAFTGWTIDKPLRGGGFIFNPRRHEPGPKRILGHTIHEQGEREGLEVLHILATSPATAHHISLELAQRFVSDNPPNSLVERMSRTFLKSHGDIRETLRTMFNSPEFWSQNNLNAKVKTPLEFVASAVRAGDMQVDHPVVLAMAVARLGMPLYNCQPPTGYSDNAAGWVSSGSLVERMNFAVAFANNRLPGVWNDWDDLMGQDSSGLTPSEKETRLEELLLHRDASPKTHDAVMKELLDTSVMDPSHNFSLGRGLAQGYMVPISQSPETQDSTRSNMPFARSRDPQAAMTAGLLIGSPDFQSR